MSDQRPDDVQSELPLGSPERRLLDRMKKSAERRAVLKVALSIPPVVMTLRARPAHAQTSSALSGNMSANA